MIHVTNDSFRWNHVELVFRPRILLSYSLRRSLTDTVNNEDDGERGREKWSKSGDAACAQTKQPKVMCNVLVGNMARRHELTALKGASGGMKWLPHQPSWYRQRSE